MNLDGPRALLSRLHVDMINSEMQFIEKRGFFGEHKRKRSILLNFLKPWQHCFFLYGSHSQTHVLSVFQMFSLLEYEGRIRSCERRNRNDCSELTCLPMDHSTYLAERDADSMLHSPLDR